ncbi:hypothetical protein C3492_39640 [Streptomyces sp. Ru62]|uniref:SH3 domain-containing protein n=1 Tax=Streptomyces sp. Ru62 TaxID=2080745 RepID=UPI000CDD3897|nr:SH3 domain-containing protein [Streptomyces sp. Ru62]POX58088.1 hypothetical protein C3492_39640 [Streptomyces sp. Ru62]
MTVHQRVKRSVAAGILALAVAVSGLATAATAQAATGHTKISCTAAKIRTAPSTTATVLGIGYRGDKVAYDRMVSHEKNWWTHGTVTRRSDGKKVRGYVVYQCANPLRPLARPPPVLKPVQHTPG